MKWSSAEFLTSTLGWHNRLIPYKLLYYEEKDENKARRKKGSKRLLDVVVVEHHQLQDENASRQRNRKKVARLSLVEFQRKKKSIWQEEKEAKWND